jgi:hypothetical protein
MRGLTAGELGGGLERIRRLGIAGERSGSVRLRTLEGRWILEGAAEREKVRLTLGADAAGTSGAEGTVDAVSGFGRMAEAVRRFPNVAEISVSLEGAVLRLSCSSTGMTAELPVMGAEGWERFPEPGDFAAAPGLDEAIRTAARFAAVGDYRPAVNGVLVEPGGVAATDGRRLFTQTIATGTERPYVLPVSKSLSRPMEGAGLEVSFTTDKSGAAFCHFRRADSLHTVKCIGAAYPNYRSVIPTDAVLDCRAVFDAAGMEAQKCALGSLRSADLRRVVTVTPDANGLARFTADGGGDAAGFSFSVKCVVPPAGEFSLRLEDLSAAVELGLNEFRYSSTGSHPAILTDSKNMRLVFLPAKAINQKQETDMSTTDNKTANPAPRQETNAPKNEGVTPAVGSPARRENTVPNGDEKPESVRPVARPEFRVVTGAAQVTGDPFDEAFRAAEELRAQLRVFAEGLNAITRRIRDARGSVKQKEREFKDTRDLIERLKRAA